LGRLVLRDYEWSFLPPSYADRENEIAYLLIFINCHLLIFWSWAIYQLFGRVFDFYRSIVFVFVALYLTYQR
jgi:hypothetical protein